MIGTAIVMNFAITGYIHVPVPIVIDEIDRSATCIIPITIPVPFFNMARRYAEINRRIPDLDGPDNNRLFTDQSWRWEITNIDAAVKAGFPNADRYSGICLPPCSGQHKCQECECCH